MSSFCGTFSVSRKAVSATGLPFLRMTSPCSFRRRRYTTILLYPNQILSKGFKAAWCINQLHLIHALSRVVFVQNPDVGADTVVHKLERWLAMFQITVAFSAMLVPTALNFSLEAIWSDLSLSANIYNRFEYSTKMVFFQTQKDKKYNYLRQATFWFYEGDCSGDKHAFIHRIVAIFAVFCVHSQICIFIYELLAFYV